MGLLDVLLGRSRPVPPNLDQLFGLPSAAVTLEASTGFRATGVGSVCFKAAEGGGFAGLADEVRHLLALDGGRFTEQTDAYGFTWLTRTTSPNDLEGLVTDLHTVNSSLVDAGFGAALLCTVVGFSDGKRTVGLVYLYKQGSWYPYAPTGSEARDSALELQIRATIANDLRVEPDLTRWFALRDAPGL